MTERRLYQFTLSPFCIKARKILEYKGIAYTTVEVNPVARGVVGRISGQKRVPVLVEREEGNSSERVIADSTAIAEHLERVVPTPSLYPADAAGRARARLLEDWSDEAFAKNLIAFKIYSPGNARAMVALSQPYYEPRWYHPLVVAAGGPILKGLAANRRAGRSLERMRRDYETDLDLLEAAAAASPFLVGDAPTVADFAVYGLLASMENLAGWELLAARPRLTAWYGRVRELGSGPQR